MQGQKKVEQLRKHSSNSSKEKKNEQFKFEQKPVKTYYKKDVNWLKKTRHENKKKKKREQGKIAEQWWDKLNILNKEQWQVT